MRYSRFLNWPMWFVINSIVFLGMLKLAEKINFSNVVLHSIIISLGLVCMVLIVNKIKYKQYGFKFENFLYWWFVDSAIVYLIVLFFQGFDLIPYVLISGFLLTLITYFLGRMRYEKRTNVLIFIFVILIAISLIFNSGNLIISQSESSQILEKIENLFR